MTRRLAVWLAGRRVATLEDADGRMELRYEPEVADDPSAAISLALPVRREPYGDAATRAFFGGLLPEGAVRDHLARRLGVSPGNDFSLLERVGGDCAGAISVLAEGSSPAGDDAGSYRWLTEAELGAELADLPERPLGVDAEGEVRLSLAGAHDKLPVRIADDGRVGLPLGGAPSSHILKAPIRGIADSVVNEAFGLGLASRLGLATVSAQPGSADGAEYLRVARYDRRLVDGRLARLHQEDMAQAIGSPAAAKYEAEGGPGIVDCVDLLRRRARRPALDLIQLVDALTVFFLVGNTDAHAKNLSLVLDEDGPRLAPLYDVLCTTCYPGLSRRLAMGIGGEDRIEYVEERHWDRLAEAAGLGVAATRRRRRALAERAPEAARAAADALREAGWDRPVLDRALERVGRAARRLSAPSP